MSAIPQPSHVDHAHANAAARYAVAPIAHEYDGIQEYDNPTPLWWHLIFIATIFFSILYFVYFTFSPLAFTPQETWAKRQVTEYKRIFGQIGELKPDEPTILKMMGDSNMMEVARGTFEGNCAACHAKDGGGINGVNLTDDSYKNVKQIADIYSVITKGANNGAMPAWENRLAPNERVIVAAYVASLRGTKPAVPKGPEGEVIPPWPKP